MIGFKAMTHVSPRAFSGIAVFPRSLSSLAVSVAALALFLVFGSWILLCGPMGSTFQGYLVGIDRFRRVQSTFYTNQTENQFQPQTPIEIAPKENGHSSSFSAGDSVETTKDSNLRMQSNQTQSDLLSDGKPESGSNQNQSDFPADGKLESGSNQNQSDYLADGKPESGSDFANETSMPLSPDLSNSSKNADSGDCDLYHGKWFYDPAGPLYTNNTCPVLTQMQNCQGNGRPDKEYENWRWKPSQCDLPRFDGKKFLELMRGKTLAFVGDSVARNQMESLLCLLWQVETPKNRGNRQMQRWYFRSNSVMIVRIWSSWLVHHSSEAFKFSPDGIAKLRLNLPDDAFFKHLPSFDVLVLSSGHWFAKQSVYILDEEIVGGQLWWPASGHKKKINNVEAFGISVEKALSAVVNHPNYTGLTIVRSYSPDHYEGGAWNTGGSCTGKVQPLSVNEMVENGFTQRMYENQVTGFERALKQMRNRSKLKLMHITGVFGMRPDGHPGPYRNLDPNKVTKRGPNGQPPPQDCLHWCMPGPVDTWNELLLEIIKRDFEGG